MTHKSVKAGSKTQKSRHKCQNDSYADSKTQVCFNYSIEVACDNNRFRWSSRRILCSLPVF